LCACGCFLIVAVVAGLVYTVMHGMWPMAAAILLFAAVTGWLGRKTVRR
jgi:hypothetical protein